eukprot:5293376-Alexandrium_andersonii.AAC.1
MRAGPRATARADAAQAPPAGRAYPERMLRRKPRSQGSPPQQVLKGMRPCQTPRERPAATGRGGSRGLGAR